MIRNYTIQRTPRKKKKQEKEESMASVIGIFLLVFALGFVMLIMGGR